MIRQPHRGAELLGLGWIIGLLVLVGTLLVFGDGDSGPLMDRLGEMAKALQAIRPN